MGIMKNFVVAGTVLLLTLNLIYGFIIPTVQPRTDRTLKIKNLDANANVPAHHFDAGSVCDGLEPNEFFPFDGISNIPIYEEIDISFDFNMENVLREGKEYRRISVKGGGIECGLHGEERPFFQYSLIIQGNIDEITVELFDPRPVDADPTPCLIPQILGSEREILAPEWKGALENIVEAEWSINHLSQTTHSSEIKELYSLKINPVEFDPKGASRAFHEAKIKYSVSDNHRRSTIEKDNDPKGPVKYLMITSPSLVEALRPLAEWKSHKGLFARIATTDEIDGNYNDGDLAFKMRKYIQEMESAHDLDYLLLVGDWDTVPTRTTVNSYPLSMYGEPSTFATDHYFACVDENTTWDDNENGDAAADKRLNVLYLAGIVTVCTLNE